MKRAFAVIMAALLSVSLLGGCAAKETEAKGKNAAPVYVMMDGLITGSYENGSFYSVSDGDGENVKSYTLADLLSPSQYQLCENGRAASKAESVIWRTNEAADVDVETLTKELSVVGDIDSSGICKVKLPVSGKAGLAGIAVPKYNFTSYFDASGEKAAPLAISGSGKLFPREIKRGAAVPAECEKALKDALLQNKLTKSAPHFNECLSGDFDGDGKKDFLAVAGNPVSADGYPILENYEGGDGYGVFSAFVYKDGKGETTLFNGDFRPCNISEGAEDNKLIDAEAAHKLEIVDAVDINGDGKFELCAVKKDWEGGSKVVFALADGKFKAVMRTNFGA